MEISRKHRKTALIFCVFLVLYSLFFAVMAPVANYVLANSPSEDVADAFSNGLIRKIIFSAISGVLSTLFYLKMLLPVPKKHKQALTVVLSLMLLSNAMSFIIGGGLSRLGFDIKTLSNLIYWFTDFYIILLIGIFFKKSTEKIAGAMIIIKALISCVLSVKSYWEVISISPISAFPMLLSPVISLIFGILPGILLLIYPVLSGPIIQKKPVPLAEQIEAEGTGNESES